MPLSKLLSLIFACLFSCLFVISSCTLIAEQNPVVTVLAIDRSSSNVQPDVRKATSQIICEKIVDKQENNDILIVFTFDFNTDASIQSLKGFENDDRKEKFKKNACRNITISKAAKPGTKISEAFFRAKKLVNQYQKDGSSGIIFMSVDAIEGDDPNMNKLREDSSNFLKDKNSRLVFFVADKTSIDIINRNPLMQEIIDFSIDRVHLGTFYDSEQTKGTNYEDILREVEDNGRKTIIDDYFSNSRLPA